MPTVLYWFAVPVLIFSIVLGYVGLVLWQRVSHGTAIVYWINALVWLISAINLLIVLSL